MKGGQGKLPATCCYCRLTGLSGCTNRGEQSYLEAIYAVDSGFGDFYTPAMQPVIIHQRQSVLSMADY